MGRSKGIVRCGVLGLLAGLVGFDLLMSDRLYSNVEMVVPLVDTAALGGATVAIATSRDLAQPVPLDQEVTAAQVDAVVKRAIALDQSATNLDATVEPGDWVVVKVNIVTYPQILDNGTTQTAFWSSGRPHWGQATDLRVVRSVIDYLVNEEGDAARVTIVEGGGEWARLGEENADPHQVDDGWTVHWEKYGNLSYADIVEEFNGANGIPVDIVDLNYDDWMGTEGVRAGDPLPVPDPNHTGIGGFQRPVDGYYVSRTLLEADKLINIPAMKTHNIPGITLLHKNYVGTFMQRAYGTRGNLKSKLHSFISGVGNLQVPAGFVDLFSYRPTDYGIIEGFWGTEGNGPQWGTDVNHNVVIAGGDPVATDAVGAAVMDYNPEDIWYLRYSAAKGFGTYDLDRIQVVGTPIAAAQRRWEKTPNPDFWGWGNRSWLVSGPHPADDVNAPAVVGEAQLQAVEGELLNGIAWQRVEGVQVAHQQKVTFPTELVGNRAATYAATCIYSNSAQGGYLYLDSDSGLKVWLNGDEVYVTERPPAGSLGDTRVPVTLSAGLNRVLVRVQNSMGGADLSFVAGDEDGDTLPGIDYALEPRPPATAIQEDEAGLPTACDLGRSYPNPFNPAAVIPYSLTRRGHVELAIYDTRGAKIRTLVDQVLPGGAHRTRWNGRDDGGKAVASGIYLYRLAFAGGRLTGRMALVR